MLKSVFYFKIKEACQTYFVHLLFYRSVTGQTVSQSILLVLRSVHKVDLVEIPFDTSVDC